jgi:hypothetical protein
VTEQRCGTCRWWGITRTQTSMFGGDIQWGLCQLPYPDSTILKSRASMRVQDGTDCPCYQRKESDEREATD